MINSTIIVKHIKERRSKTIVPDVGDQPDKNVKFLSIEQNPNFLGPTKANFFGPMKRNINLM